MSLEGNQFGKITILGKAGVAKDRHILWLCRCVCGTEFVTTGSHIKSGHTQSCGCGPSGFRSKHGHCTGQKQSQTYSVWLNMKDRCFNDSNVAYHNYGGRGITVHPRWMVFANFLEDMGAKPDGKTLDRIDNDGNYEPVNCRWVDPITQASNKRNNVFLTFDGVTDTVSGWTRRIGASREFLRDRLYRGWPVEDAIAKPKGYRRKK